MQQVFIEQKAAPGARIELDQEQAHHLSTVLRMKNKATLRIVDSDQKVFLAELEIVGKSVFARCVQAMEESAERRVPVTLLIGLIKKEKWDFCLQKSTELGVTRIVPFESQRTIVKASEEKNARKKERWQKIAREAAQQCKRERIPSIEEPLPLLQAAEKWASEQNFVAYEAANQSALKLREQLKPDQSISIVIGPEGGFSEEEIEQLKEKGYECITLGKRILRAETAAIYALSAIDAILE